MKITLVVQKFCRTNISFIGSLEVICEKLEPSLRGKYFFKAKNCFQKILISIIGVEIKLRIVMKNMQLINIVFDKIDFTVYVLRRDRPLA